MPHKLHGYIYTMIFALCGATRHFFIFLFFFHLTYSRSTSSLPFCLWSQRIFPSLPDSRLTIFHRDASSALLQLVNQWLNFTYSRSHAFRYERKNTNPTFDKNQTHDFRTSRCAAYLLDHSGDEQGYILMQPYLQHQDIDGHLLRLYIFFYAGTPTS